MSMPTYEIQPRKDHCGVDLISDALPFGRLWYGEGQTQSPTQGSPVITAGPSQFAFASLSRRDQL